MAENYVEVLISVQQFYSFTPSHIEHDQWRIERGAKDAHLPLPPTVQILSYSEDTLHSLLFRQQLPQSTSQWLASF